MTSNLRILFVDDEKELLDIFNLLLEMDGHQVTCATNYNDALALVEENPFDLVITDYRMPRWHGIYLLDMIKDRRPEMPVIMITAYEKDEMIAEARRKGVDLVLGKPFEYETLLESIENLMAKKGK